jgi:glyoxylase-like metal-dependent hydrolase (beta-lactamase superfamily II)
MPADSVDTVVFTHLHNDHTRGAVWAGRPTFPGADHVVNTAEAAFWESELDDRPGHRGVPLSARYTLQVAGPTVRRIEFDTDIAPGVRAISAAGHTPGHMAVLLSSEGERLLCLGDTFYDRIQLRRPDWWTRFDVDGPASIAARRRLLAWAADEDIPVTVYHMPFPGLGRIRRAGAAYDWMEGI